MGDDVLSMSLDDIIKKQRNQKAKRPKVLAGKWASRKQQSGLFKGRVPRKPQTAARGQNNYQGISPIKRPSIPGRGRNPRARRGNWNQGRANQQPGPTGGQGKGNFRYFNNVKFIPKLMGVSRLDSYRKRRNDNRTGTGNTRQQKISSAIKSVRLAQLRLRKLQAASSSRPRQFAPNRNRPRTGISNRIRAGKFGFVTTRKESLEERRAIMQNKILRAQIARSGQRTPVAQSFPGPSRKHSRSRSYYGREDPLPPPPPPSRRGRRTEFSPRARGGRRSNEFREEFRSFSRSRAPWEGDNWDPQPRRVQNDLYDPYHNAQMERTGFQVQTVTRSLNPDLQRKISRIQEQGRMSRGDEKYEPINDTSEQFRRNIISTSTMSLSDRFKRFMK